MSPRRDAEAARYVHWGATSQDVIDTAAMLTLRAGIDALLADLDRAIAGFAELARHIATPRSSARTWLQHALPMPFGLKLAEYAAALHRSKLRLKRLREETLALQFGGAAGTLAALGDKGLAVVGSAGARAQAAAAGSALAHPSRPHRGSGLGARDPRRQLRQDRARRLADDADRCRRSLRAGGRRPRRLLDHAAQAQSGCRRERAWRRDHGAQSRRDDLCRAGAGPRAQRRPLACGMADLAGADAGHLGRARRDRRSSPKGWRSMWRACAPISTPRTG